MAKSTLAPFHNTRAEILIGSPAKRIYGWVDPLSEESLVFQSDCRDEILPGTPAIIIFRNVSVTMAAQTVFDRKYDDKLVFHSPPSYMKRRGDSTARVRGVIDVAYVQSEDGAYYSEVLDVSESGMAFICLDFVRPGTELSLSVKLDRKEVTFKLRAAYCQAVEANIAAYRVGGIIVGMSRTDQVRWRQMIAQGAA